MCENSTPYITVYRDFRTQPVMKSWLSPWWLLSAVTHKTCYDKNASYVTLDYGTAHK
jgi:hypothetical protein